MFHRQPVGWPDFPIVRTLFLAVNLSKQNLFDVVVVSCLICTASELRTHAFPGSELPTALKRVA
jgi:hypothetical protein